MVCFSNHGLKTVKHFKGKKHVAGEKCVVCVKHVASEKPVVRGKGVARSKPVGHVKHVLQVMSRKFGNF